MNTNHKVKLYALSTCVHCRNTKELLNGCGVFYECIDVDQLDSEARKSVLEEVRSVNPSCSFPTLIIGSSIIVGFREDRIREALSTLG